jgi:nitroreductase
MSNTTHSPNGLIELDNRPAHTLSFEETVRERRSFRSFLPTPVSDAHIRQVLEDAQRSPSNCNTQPWQTHIVSGAKIQELGRILTEENEAQNYTPDFSFDDKCFYGAYGERQRAHGKTYYESMGVAREDKVGRHLAAAKNCSFYGAPHAALLFMPSFGDNVRVGGDIGMYGQTFLLSLTARGLGGIPQTMIGYFAQTIRDYLDISDEFKMMFAIAFGHPDFSEPVNNLKMGRVPLSESVTFHN